MRTGVVWIIGIYQVDYLWVKSQANVCLRGVWKLSTFNDFFNILFCRYYLKRSEKRSWKGHGKVIEFHSWIFVWTMGMSPWQPLLGLRNWHPFVKGALTLNVSGFVSEPLIELCLHHIRSESKVIRGHGHFGSDHMNRRLGACALHNLGWTRTSASEEITTCCNELGNKHGSV